MSVNKPFLVGVSGGSGCGKTTVLAALFNAMPKNSLALVSQDDYYLDIEKQPKDSNGKENFDLPESLNEDQFTQNVNLLMNNKQVVINEYTFNNDANEGSVKIIEPAPIIIVEGLFVFHFEEIQSKIDYRVFVETCEETRLVRRISRDGKERGYEEHDVRYQWDNHVEPAYQTYLKPYIDSCDQIINNSVHFQEDLDKLVEFLKTKLNNH